MRFEEIRQQFKDEFVLIEVTKTLPSLIAEEATFVAPRVGGAGVIHVSFPPIARTRSRRAVRVTTDVAAPPLHGAP